MANLADQVLLFLVAGTRADAVETYCVGPGKQTPEQAKIIIAEARKRLTIAATFNRDEQFGKAISRLEDLYSKSITAADIRSALQAQRELNRLLNLYSDNRTTEANAGDLEMLRQLDLVSTALLPLNLVAADYPIEEHARVAAEVIRLNGLSK